jgi:hypothetical protein
MGGLETRITAYSALAVAALFAPLMGVQIAHPFPPLTQPEELAALLAAHRTELLVGLCLSGLGWGGLLIVFGGGLWAILRRAEGGSGMWSAVAFAACVATAAAILIVITLTLTLVHLAPSLPADSLRVLYEESLVANLMTAYPNAVYVAAAGIVIWRTGVLPRWVAYGGFLVAAVHLASSVSVAREGAFSPLGVLPSLAPLTHFLWLVGVAFALLRTSAPPPGASARRVPG